MKRLALVVALTLAGCCGEQRGPSEVVLTPEAELVTETTSAVERWVAAGGLDIRIGEGGTRVVLKPAVVELRGGYEVSDDPAADGPHRCGVYLERLREIWLSADPRCDRAMFAAHEIGHLLGGDDHHGQGVMFWDPAPGAPIDAAALEAVCARVTCAAFNPEN